jgi:hypothetical protein
MSDYYPDYLALRDLMVKCAPEMSIAKDIQGEITLNLPPSHTLDARTPVWFGSVRTSRQLIGYYLMPLNQAELQAQVPASLKKYMSGKTCFNFTHATPEILTQMEALTRLCARHALGQTRKSA